MEVAATLQLYRSGYYRNISHPEMVATWQLKKENNNSKNIFILGQGLFSLCVP